jgi:hypothetical protein
MKTDLNYHHHSKSFGLKNRWLTIITTYVTVKRHHVQFSLNGLYFFDAEHKIIMLSLSSVCKWLAPSIWGKVPPAQKVTNYPIIRMAKVALGGLVVSVLPTEGDGFLRVIKIRSTTSFGGEVKPSVPRRRFTACKRTLRAWIELVILVSKIQRPFLTQVSWLTARWLWQSHQDE